MTDRTGILSNSPLIFALASVRFAAWPLMAKKIDEIQDALRFDVPIIQRIEVRQVGPNGLVVNQDERGTTSAWMLLSSDRSFGFQLTPDQILFFSRQYLRYRDFSNILTKGLKVLFDHMHFMDVTNIGVRYIDHVVPARGEGLEKYVNTTLLPPQFDALKNRGGAATWMYNTDDGTDLRVRTNSQPDTLRYPEDLVAVLAMSHDPVRPLQLETLNENEMVLDIDAYAVTASPVRMDVTSIVERLAKLHEEANRVFRSTDVCTDYAFAVWKKETLK